MNSVVRVFVWVLMTVVAIGLPRRSVAAAETADATKGRGQATGRVAVPPEAKKVADFLRRMGRHETARRFESDILNKKVRFGAIKGQNTGSTFAQVEQTEENRVVAAVKDATFVSDLKKRPPEDNVMVINAKEFFGQMTAKSSNKDTLLMNWALTVEHEYVHMGQSEPEQRPRDEDPAVRQALSLAHQFIRRIRNDMSEARLLPDSAEKAARLANLAGQLEAASASHSDCVIGIIGNIEDGYVSKGLDWGGAEYGNNKSLREIVDLVKQQTARDARLAREDAAATEARVKNGSGKAKTVTGAEAEGGSDKTGKEDFAGTWNDALKKAGGKDGGIGKGIESATSAKNDGNTDGNMRDYKGTITGASGVQPLSMKISGNSVEANFMGTTLKGTVNHLGGVVASFKETRSSSTMWGNRSINITVNWTTTMTGVIQGPRASGKISIRGIGSDGSDLNSSATWEATRIQKRP